jgi:hypothetical protein
MDRRELETLLDPLALSARVGAAEAAWAAHRASWAADRARASAEDDPLAGRHRAVAGASLHRTLAEKAAPPPSSSPGEPSGLEVASAERELWSALARWVAFLTLERIAAPADAEVERAFAAKVTAPVLGLPPRGGPSPGERLSFRELVDEILLARDAAAAAAWCGLATEAAGSVAGALARAGALRREVAARIPADPLAMATVPGEGALGAAAERFLAATRDLATEVLRVPGAPPGFPSQLRSALAQDATEGWPARLGPRWLVECFAGAPSASAPSLPRFVCGGSTFARAARLHGEAVHRALRPRGLPFVLARSPLEADARATGLLFASALATRVFHRRALRASARVADAQARALARCMLFSARRAAARVAAGEVAARAHLLGEPPMPAPLASVLLAPTTAAFVEFAAWLDLPASVTRTEERFDEDWFANPRFGADLAARVAAGARPLAPEEGAERVLAARLEATLA